VAQELAPVAGDYRLERPRVAGSREVHEALVALGMEQRRAREPGRLYEATRSHQ
jgi:hypothetical protein